MKKIFFSVIFLTFFVSAFSIIAMAAESDVEVQPLAVCTNHDYTDFGGYNQTYNQHTYYCSNDGCNAYEVESCYITFCGFYNTQDSAQCERCQKGTLTNIHDYEPVPDTVSSDYKHTYTCTRYDEDLWAECGKTGITESCTLGDTYIWRGFVENHGHILTKTCTICNFKRTIGYFYPQGHPNYFSTDNNCTYCQMESPYNMEFDQ